MTPALQPIADEQRDEPRASLYLAASLYSDGQSVPVKIRNLSTMGALIELSTPIAGTGVVQLVRGPLIVFAVIIWAEGNQCGLKFSGAIDVQHWRSAPANGEQQRVDDIVRLVKSGAILPAASPAQIPETKEDRPLSADLKLAAELLFKLGERLAGDEAVIASHGAELQNLDIALQMIGAVEAMLSGQSDLVSDTSKIVGLRRSADQALAATTR
jgi:hypothetical protein